MGQTLPKLSPKSSRLHTNLAVSVSCLLKTNPVKVGVEIMTERRKGA